MAKTASRERTSDAVASTAGRLLNGSNVKAAEAWLQRLVDAPGTTDEARSHAVTLLGTLAQTRRVAASALTQR